MRLAGSSIALAMVGLVAVAPDRDLAPLLLLRFSVIVIGNFLSATPSAREWHCDGHFQRTLCSFFYFLTAAFAYTLVSLSDAGLQL